MSLSSFVGNYPDMCNRINTSKVSVCIPAFNTAEYLRQTAEPIPEKNHQYFEIVIVANCSTDHTVRLVNELHQLSRRYIRFYKNEHRLGLHNNLNRYLEYANGSGA